MARYDLVEIFESLQGEGRNSGRPCVFIRFAHCNLACPWCDTDCSCRFSLALDELIKELENYSAKSVILTGGEPTLVKDMPELIAALKEKGYWLGIETNATHEPEWLQFIDYVACSPKLEYRDRIVLKRADEVRVVASSEDAWQFCKWIHETIAANDYYVSPCDYEGKIDFATAKSILGKLSGWSLSVQLHKLLGFR